ncbi:hypothetical protein VTN77DRAFT_2373 [Rasamsonia byssochlamydoides]|uniref:uncharacterized protein n=1 Tax=Rasamsonia byssochlamydoides TaxID=89139 RepID=UPI003743A51F
MPGEPVVVCCNKATDKSGLYRVGPQGHRRGDAIVLFRAVRNRVILYVYPKSHKLEKHVCRQQASQEKLKAWPLVLDPGNVVISKTSNEAETRRHAEILRKWRPHWRRIYQNASSPTHAGQEKVSRSEHLHFPSRSYATLIGEAILQSRAGSLTEKSICESIMLSHEWCRVHERSGLQKLISEELERNPYFEAVSVRRLGRIKKATEWRFKYRQVLEGLSDDSLSRCFRWIPPPPTSYSLGNKGPEVVELPASELCELPDSSFGPPVELPDTSCDSPPSYSSLSRTQSWKTGKDSDFSVAPLHVSDKDQVAEGKRAEPVELASPSAQRDEVSPSQRPKLRKLVTNGNLGLLPDDFSCNGQLHCETSRDEEESSQEHKEQSESNSPERERNPATSNRPQPSNEREEDENLSQDEDEDGSHRKRRRFHSPGRGQPRRRFACVYRKHDPETYGISDRRYLVCAGTGFRYISELIRHLTRTHDEHIFGKCLRSFENEGAREDHVKQCTIRLKCSQEELWAGLWNARFPGSPIPKNICFGTMGKRSSLSVNTLLIEQSTRQLSDDPALSSSWSASSSSSNTLASDSPATTLFSAASNVGYNPKAAGASVMLHLTNDIQNLRTRVDSLEKRFPLVEETAKTATLLIQLMISSNPDVSHAECSIPNNYTEVSHEGPRESGIIPRINIRSHPDPSLDGLLSSVSNELHVDEIGQEILDTSPLGLYEFIINGSDPPASTIDLTTSRSEEFGTSRNGPTTAGDQDSQSGHCANTQLLDPGSESFLDPPWAEGIELQPPLDFL